jgi:hypothetical protein
MSFPCVFLLEAADNPLQHHVRILVGRRRQKEQVLADGETGVDIAAP